VIRETRSWAGKAGWWYLLLPTSSDLKGHSTTKLGIRVARAESGGALVYWYTWRTPLSAHAP